MANVGRWTVLPTRSAKDHTTEVGPISVLSHGGREFNSLFVEHWRPTHQNTWGIERWDGGSKEGWGKEGGYKRRVGWREGGGEGEREGGRDGGREGGRGERERWGEREAAREGGREGGGREQGDDGGRDDTMEGRYEAMILGSQ